MPAVYISLVFHKTNSAIFYGYAADDGSLSPDKLMNHCPSHIMEIIIKILRTACIGACRTI